MFGMGMTEIMVILVIALIFLGPEKLPEAAAKISKGIREIRKQSKELQNTIETDTEIGGAIRDLKSALRGDEIRRPPVRQVPPGAETPKPPAIAESTAESTAEATAAAAATGAAAESPGAPPAEAPAEPAGPAAPAEPAAVAAAATADPDEPAADDPIRLIRPATGTAKREHG